MTIDEALAEASGGLAPSSYARRHTALQTLAREVKRLRASEQELTRLRLAVMALVDKWRALAEELAKEREEFADVAEQAADQLERVLRIER